MVRVEVDADAAYEKAQARRAKADVEPPTTGSSKKDQAEKNRIFKKSLRLAQRHNLIVKNSILLEEKLDKVKKKQVSMIQKYVDNMRKEQKKVLLGGLQTTLARGAEGGPEVPGGGKEDKKKNKSFKESIALGLKLGGILLLVSVLYKMVANSKIATAINQALNKGLGLLLDLVLLPFLPQIIYWMMWWYKAIVDFGDWWKGVYGRASDPITALKAEFAKAEKDFQYWIDKLFGEGTFASWKTTINKFITDSQTSFDSWSTSIMAAINKALGIPTEEEKQKAHLTGEYGFGGGYAGGRPGGPPIPPGDFDVDQKYIGWEGEYTPRGLGDRPASGVTVIPNWVIQVQADRWVDPNKIQADVQNMVDQMMWVIKQANKGS